MKSPAQLAETYADSLRWNSYDESIVTEPELCAIIVAAIEDDRKQRADRIVIASADGARTWIGGDTLADLLGTVNGYLADGYFPEELIIEGITR